MEGEVRNTKENLMHYFGNHVSGLKVLSEMGHTTPEDSKRCQREFIAGIELTIEKLRAGNIPLAGNIGEPQLREMLQLAQVGDWAQPLTIRSMYQLYARLTGEKYSDKFLEGN